MPGSQQENTIVDIGIQHTLFISEEEKISPKLFGFYFLQVDASKKSLLYRDGLLYKQLGPGPHRWWSAFWHTWKEQRINMRTENIPFTIKGRVRGPAMPNDIPGAAAVDLACDVTAEIDLVCKLADVQAHLQHSEPLSMFFSTVKNIVVEIIGQLPYDKYGSWVTELRDKIMDRLTGMGRGNVERSVGIRVEDVLVKSFQPNTAHDRNMIANYQLVERVRRESAEAQAKAERDMVAAKSFGQQGEVLNISPAILALKDSPIGVALIESDANLRKLSIAAGLNPGVNIQPIQDPSNQQQSLGPGAVTGYLNPPQTRGQSGQNTFPPAIQQASGPLYPPFQQPSGPLYSQSQQPSSPSYPPLQQTTQNTNATLAGSSSNASSASDPVDPARQARELAALQQSGFETAGEGKVTPVFDQYGNATTKEWVLQIAAPRGNGYLMMVFHCPAGYPAVPPAVQLKNPTGGGLQWIEPNTLQNWDISHMLVEIAQEISNDIP